MLTRTPDSFQANQSPPDGGLLADSQESRGANRCVHISRLMLTDFRSYASLSFETEGQSVVLTGANGAGKTNILEALSFLVPGRGLRRARLSDVARLNASGRWAVAADVLRYGEKHRVGTGIEGKGGAERRLVRINGETSKSQADLGQVFTAIWLTPSMDRLFQGGPSSRRRFLDRLVYAFDPAHAARTGAYSHALKQRVALLKQGRQDDRWLSGLEDAMATNGVAVAAARREVVARLNRSMDESDGLFPAADMTCDGAVEQWLNDLPAVEVEDRLRSLLASERRNDAVRGGAAEGVHKTDLTVVHRQREMPAALCSTGEQKAMVLAIVLSHARAQARARGLVPVMLLDEVAAHLDDVRRAALFEEIDSMGAQVFMTGTDASLFDSMRGRARFFTVKDSVVMQATETLI